MVFSSGISRLLVSCVFATGMMPSTALIAQGECKAKKLLTCFTQDDSKLTSENFNREVLAVDFTEIFAAYKQMPVEEFDALVEESLANNPELAHCAIDAYGNTLLHVLICLERVELFEKVIKQYNADLNRKNEWELTPLALAIVCIHQAIQKEGDELFKKIYEDSLLYESTSNSMSAISCVDSFEQAEHISEQLSKDDSTLNVFELLGEFGTARNAAQLEAWIRSELKRDPRIGSCAVDKHGNTLLHISCCHKMIELTEFLLPPSDSTVNQLVNAVNGWGLTPMGMVLLCDLQRQTLLKQAVHDLLSGPLDEEPALIEEEQKLVNETEYSHHDEL